MKYYIPINSTSLSHYYATACIMPASFYSNKPQDIQNHLPNVLLVTTNKGCPKCDCCFEIVLTDKEKKELIDIKNGFYLYEDPLPISRISKILFLSREQMQTTVNLIRQATAFIPEELISIEKSFDNRQVSWDNVREDMEFPMVGNNQKKALLFNRYLGALALMRTAHAKGMSVSPRFIDTVSFFNSFIKSEKKKFGSIDEKLYSYLNPSSDPTFSQRIDEDLLYKKAKDNGTAIEKNKITRVIEIEKLKWPVYAYAVLQQYGVGDESARKRIDELILENFQKGIQYGEFIAFFYGFNRGYTVFNNVYRKDTNEVNVKFEMNSQLDYYIVESVYQYAFNNVVSSQFPYIDLWCPKQSPKSIRGGAYRILDTVIKDKKKIEVFSEEWWKEFVPGFIQNFDLQINFFGQKIDMTARVITELLRPFASKIQDDIKSVFEEEKESLIEQCQNEVKKQYIGDITERDNQISELKAQLQKLKESQVESATESEEHNDNAGVENTTESIVADDTQFIEESSRLNAEANTRKLVREAIALAKEKDKDLKAKVEAKYNISTKNKKKDELIFILLELNNQENNLDLM